MEEGRDLRDELVELDALLERLRLKRYDLIRKINRIHSPIIRQLPPDVMSTIFEFCLPNSTNRQLWEISPYDKENNFSILSLGAICSYWREIAWSTPSLWSSLVVCNPSECDSHRVTGIARDWLARSGRLPLSIRISSFSYNKTILALINIISQYSTRWSDLVLYIPDSYYDYLAPENHAPILISIQFHRNITRKLNFRLTCPRLERASLGHFPLDGSNIQWDNLTHLTLHFTSLIDFFIILRKTPRLVFCQISGYISLHRPEEQNISALVLTSLRSLHLMVDICSGVQDFLNNLTAPHLEEFSLQRKNRLSIGDVTSFFRRSACSLRSLSMTFKIFSYYFEGFMNILQSMPSLTTLSIQSVTSFEISNHPKEYDPRNISELVVKILSSQSTSLKEGFLPNLRILEYTGELYLRSGSYDDLYPLPPADNVAHGPFHLLKLEIHPANRIPENMISYVSSLMERGITVNVLSDSKDILQSSIDYYRSRKETLRRDWYDDLDLTFLS